MSVLFWNLMLPVQGAGGVDLAGAAQTAAYAPSTPDQGLDPAAPGGAPYGAAGAGTQLAGRPATTRLGTG